VTAAPPSPPPLGLAAAPRRILILKPCCLGDLVQCTALIAAVRARWPSAAITVATSRWSAAAVVHDPAVSGLVDSGDLGRRSLRHPAALLRFCQALRRRRFDLAIVPDRSPVPALLTGLAGIPVRAGYDSGGRGRWYTLRVAPFPRAHELDQMQRLAAAVGVGALPLPRFLPGPQGRAEARALRNSVDPAALFALLAPGGGHNPGTRMPGKRWSAAGFAAVATALQAAGAAVALVGAESDRGVTADVLRQTSHVHDLTGLTSFDGLGALAASAHVFVGNDSGVTHLAAASGCPTVAVFGPTAADLYGPRGRWVRTLAPPASQRRGGDGSIRHPYTFYGVWQDGIPAAAVSAAALEGIRTPWGGP
jgi:heptosyltransferase II